MGYCSKCGASIEPDDSFCPSCGKPVKRRLPVTKPSPPASSSPSRSIVWEGKLHKCPNCGQLLEAFVTRCPSCEYEVRDTSATSNVANLMQQIESVEYEKTNNVINHGVLGFAFKDEEMEGQRINRCNERIASLIRGFPVPNTREELYEFALAASAHIDSDTDDDISKAWVQKLDLVKEKADLMLSESDREPIDRVYNEAHRKMKRKWVLLGVALLACLALILLPAILF